MDEVREYEQTMQEKTNSKVKSNPCNTGEVTAPDYTVQKYSRAWEGRQQGGLKERRENTAGCETSEGSERRV